ncbi:MgtC/SapB family protein [Halobacteriaceae archaeon GCM10025711]
MTGVVDLFANAPIDSRVVKLALAIALGLFLGLEREWSQKAAGIRTFALVSVLGAMFTFYDTGRCEATGSCLPVLTGIGGLLVVLLVGVLMVNGLLDDDEGLHLTTAVSMMVAYGVGVLVAVGDILPATVVAVSSSLLLVFKRELHSFAWGLSREELRSTIEFSILAFVVYPLLPAEPVTPLGIEPRVVWLMVVTVAGIGIVNYAIVNAYGGRGVAVTGFFGGLASSTAVVGTMLDHVRQRPEAARYAVAAVLLADAAMALRNLAIAIAFTASGDVLVGAIAPLGALVIGSVVIVAVTADWSEEVEISLDSPFSLRNALGFGVLFLLVIVAGTLAQARFGTVGFLVTAALSGLVSSASATTTAVVLYRSGSLGHDAAVLAVLLATAASLGVKAALTVTASSRTFTTRVVAWTAALFVLAGVSLS